MVIVAKLDLLKSHSMRLVNLEQLYSACANQKRNIPSNAASLIGKQLQHVLPDSAREGNSQGPETAGMVNPAVAEVQPYYSTGIGDHRL